MDFLTGYVPLSEEDIMEYFTDAQKYTMMPWEDRMGMKVTSGVVTLEKDQQNLVGISIGGGSPHCPCLYVVQVFDGTPASREGTLAAGDEIVGIGGLTVKGKTKSEVARMIQTSKDRVSINFNKLHADPKQGKTLDLILKKVKHRVVEGMTSGTADALGLSRAILCNDSMVKKLKELEATEALYRNLVLRTKMYLNAYYNLSLAYRAFGDVFSSIGVREPLPQASLVFSKFGDTHRELEKNAQELIRIIKPMMGDLNTYLSKAIPDTKLTIKKYLDIKFEYLSYCLKVKEMDDEEYSCHAMNEYLYRVETGNYEYRLILRCRQEARVRFAKIRNDVLVKLELLDNKRVQDMVFQLQRFVAALAKCHSENHGVMKENQLFPIEVDLSGSTFSYNTTGQLPPDDEDDDGKDVCSSPASPVPSLVSTFDDPGSQVSAETGDGGRDGNSCAHRGEGGRREESTELQRDLFDFFLDSPAGLVPSSAVPSATKDFLDRQAKQADGFNGNDDLDMFSNSRDGDGISKNESPAKPSIDESAAEDSQANRVEDLMGFLRSLTGDIDAGGVTARNASNNCCGNGNILRCEGEPAGPLGGPDNNSSTTVDAINRAYQEHCRETGNPPLDDRVEGHEDDHDDGNCDEEEEEDDDDLDDDFFFEAINSLSSPGDDFVKDFMHGSRDADREIPTAPVEIEGDDAPSTDQPSVVDHPLACSASKDDVLIDLNEAEPTAATTSSTSPPPTTTEKSLAAGDLDGNDPRPVVDCPLLPL